MLCSAPRPLLGQEKAPHTGAGLGRESAGVGGRWHLNVGPDQVHTEPAALAGGGQCTVVAGDGCGTSSTAASTGRFVHRFAGNLHAYCLPRAWQRFQPCKVVIFIFTPPRLARSRDKSKTQNLHNIAHAEATASPKPVRVPGFQRPADTQKRHPCRPWPGAFSTPADTDSRGG